jgi:hypothetical protein
MCIVGRRERTRGLYLDRRSFMHSYDPSTDDADGTILGRILGAVVLVCKGINLQYFFSALDSRGCGTGTKLPHNVTSLLGVMDGAASDLRTGLPWQGVELHEPIRLLMAIETTPEVMRRIMARNEAIRRLIVNGWVQLALLDPESSQILIFIDGDFTHLRAASKDSSECSLVSGLVSWLARTSRICKNRNGSMMDPETWLSALRNYRLSGSRSVGADSRHAGRLRRAAERTNDDPYRANAHRYLVIGIDWCDRVTAGDGSTASVDQAR